MISRFFIDRPIAANVIAYGDLQGEGAAAQLERLSLTPSQLEAFARAAPGKDLNLSLDEIATAMGCALGTVKSTLHAAHARLALDIEDEIPEVEAGVVNVPTTGRFDQDMMTMKMLGVSQRVPLFGANGLARRAAREAAAAEGAAAAMSHYELFGAAWPEWPAEDFKRLGEPFDFLGVNWYTRALTRHDPSLAPIGAARVVPADATVMETGWEVHPPSLTATLTWVRERYGDVPIYITENGAAFTDPPVTPEGRIEDPLRIRYLHDHLAAIHDAMRAGVDVRGYFVWSLLDNFEWPSGYSKHFGIVQVDFDTQARTIKDSGWFYRDLIRSRGGVLNTERLTTRP